MRMGVTTEEEVQTYRQGLDAGAIAEAGARLQSGVGRWPEIRRALDILGLGAEATKEDVQEALSKEMDKGLEPVIRAAKAAQELKCKPGDWPTERMHAIRALSEFLQKATALLRVNNTAAKPDWEAGVKRNRGKPAEDERRAEWLSKDKPTDQTGQSSLVSNGRHGESGEGMVDRNRDRR